MTMPIPCQRDLFDIPEDVAWLNCAYMSPLMKPAVEAGEAGIRGKAQPWTIKPRDFFPGPEEARALFARIVNAEPDEIAIVPSASYGLAVAARNLTAPLPARVSCCWTSNFRPTSMSGGNSPGGPGRVIDTVQRPADDDWTARGAGRDRRRCALAALPNSHWTDGGLVDLERVAAALREAGAALALDITQSGGALPLDVKRVRPNFLVCASYKWLLGPYSLGFLYVDPKHHGGSRWSITGSRGPGRRISPAW